jgi:hypothetical protein
MLRVFYNMAHLDFKIRQNVMYYIFDVVSKITSFRPYLYLQSQFKSHMLMKYSRKNYVAGMSRKSINRKNLLNVRRETV